MRLEMVQEKMYCCKNKYIELVVAPYASIVDVLQEVALVICVFIFLLLYKFWAEKKLSLWD